MSYSNNGLIFRPCYNSNYNPYNSNSLRQNLEVALEHHQKIVEGLLKEVLVLVAEKECMVDITRSCKSMEEGWNKLLGIFNDKKAKTSHTLKAQMVKFLENIFLKIIARESWAENSQDFWFATCRWENPTAELLLISSSMLAIDLWDAPPNCERVGAWAITDFGCRWFDILWIKDNYTIAV